MSVRLAHGGLPSDITPYQLKRFLRRARVSLGLSKGAIEYLVFAIDNCQASDFAQDRICAIWHSLERLAQTFGLSKRQVGRIEAELVGAGLIRRTYPERKSRSGDRVDGVIKRAAGINLAPLIGTTAGDPKAPLHNNSAQIAARVLKGATTIGELSALIKIKGGTAQCARFHATFDGHVAKCIKTRPWEPFK